MTDSSERKGPSPATNRRPPVARDDVRYTMTDAARLKGVSYHTVSRAVRQGRLPATRLGRMALISATDLNSWQPMRERAPLRYRHEPQPAEDGPTLLQGDSLGSGVDLAQDLSSLIEMFHAASSQQSMHDLSMVIAEQFASVFHMRSVSVWQMAFEERRAIRMARVGPPQSAVQGNVVLGDQFQRLMAMIEKGHARVSSRPASEFQVGDVPNTDLPTDPTLIVPLRIRDRTIGAVTATRGAERLDLSQDQLTLAQVLANQAALALDHTRLREHESLRLNQLTAVLDQMEDQVRACDASGRLNLINRADMVRAGRPFGGPRIGDDARSNPSISGRFELDGSPVPLDRHPLARALKGEVVDNWEYLIETKDGRTERYRASARPIVENNEITGAVTIARDITQLRENERLDRERQARIARFESNIGMLSDMMQRVSETDTVAEVARICLETAVAETHAIGGIVFRMFEGESLVPLLSVGGIDLELAVITDDPVANSTTILAFSRRSPMLVHLGEAARAERATMQIVGADELVVSPIFHGSRQLGAMHLYRSGAPRLTDEDLRITAVIAAHCAQALERIRLRRRTQVTEARLDAILAAVPLPAVIVERESQLVVSVNRAAELWTELQFIPGVSRLSEIQLEYRDGDPRAGTDESLANRVLAVSQFEQVHADIASPHGERTHVLISASPVPEVDDTPQAVALVFEGLDTEGHGVEHSLISALQG